MDKKQIILFIGTTAELIKLVPVIQELKKKKINFKIISSNQNILYLDELEPLVGKLSIYYKSVIKLSKPILNSEYLSFVFWSMKTLGNFIFYFRREFKDRDKKNIFMIVHGDTISSLIGAIAAKINRVKIVHIESGLRSYNFLEPFPEEISRVIISRLADIHFCPNSWSVDNLKNIGGVKVSTGNNTLIETVDNALKIKKFTKIEKDIIKRRFFILVLHRQEHILFKKNKTKRLLKMFIKNANKDFTCVLVLHKLTEDFMKQERLLEDIKKNKNIILVARLPYVQFINLMSKAEFIATDGGSNQEEAYYMGKPCIILRDFTERIEGLGENAILSHGDEKTIRNFIKNYKKFERKAVQVSMSPAKVIVDNLVKY